jgi:hypothetical protein
MIPHVTAEPPSGWVAAEIASPKIAESAGAVMIDWRAARSPEDSAAFVTGCVATPIPGWVEDMRPAIDARTTALAGASAAMITAAPIDMRADARETLFVLRAANDLGGPPIGSARTFLGFDESRVFTCFATCADRPRAGAPRHDACARSVLTARLDGSSTPPRPGLGLRGVTWAVHHPRPTALGGGVIVLLAGILAIAARRRPRSGSAAPEGERKRV